MANYTVKLSDDKKLSLSADTIALYPTIQDQIGDISGNTLCLSYPDTEALYLTLTTNFKQSDHDIDMYIRLIGTVDYLGNDSIVDNMIQKFLTWFDDPNKLANLKQQKQHVKYLLSNLSVTTLWKFIEPYQKFCIQYIFDRNGLTSLDAISPNLDYIVSCDKKSPDVYIFKQGREIMFTKSALKPIHMAISDDGDIYMVEVTREHKMQIVKHEIFNPKGPIHVRNIQDQVHEIHLATDGSKYMIIDYPGFEEFYLKYRIRDMLTHNNIIDRHRKGHFSSSPAPRMTVVVGEDMAGDENRYFIDNIDNSMKDVQKSEINGQKITFPVSVNYNSSLDTRKNNIAFVF